MADWRDGVDQWWAGILRVPVSTVRGGGVIPLDDADHVGVVAVKHAAGPVVYGPAQLLPQLRAAARTAGHALADGTRLAAVLAPRACSPLGPAWYGYASAGTIAGRTGRAVRPLVRADLPRLARLHAQTPPAQREESGTTGLPGFGYLAGDDLLAVACLGMWRGMPSIGVLTHPQARGCGLARQVVSAAAREGLKTNPVVQYRAWASNGASLAVAAACGFVHYCDGLVLDVGPVPVPVPVPGPAQPRRRR